MHTPVGLGCSFLLSSLCFERKPTKREVSREVNDSERSVRGDSAVDLGERGEELPSGAFAFRGDSDAEEEEGGGERRGREEEKGGKREEEEEGRRRNKREEVEESRGRRGKWQTCII